GRAGRHVRHVRPCVGGRTRRDAVAAVVGPRNRRRAAGPQSIFPDPAGRRLRPRPARSRRRLSRRAAALSLDDVDADRADRRRQRHRGAARRRRAHRAQLRRRHDRARADAGGVAGHDAPRARFQRRRSRAARGDAGMIPSYDDLTPGIPDVVDAETVKRLEIFFYRQLPSPPRGLLEPSTPKTDQEPQATRLALGSSPQLYACLACHRATADRQPQTADREPPTVDRGPQTLLAIARDFSPRIMRVGEGEVLLDVGGLGRLIGDPPAIARELRRAIVDAEADAAVAIAPTQTMARLLAAEAHDYPIERFAEIPVARLQPLETLPPAMNHRDRARPYLTFEKWGIATLGDLAALPAADLSSRLGRRGVALQRLARGLDPRPFVPDAETPRYIGRLELEWPIEELEPLSFVLARLLEPLAIALERADRGAAAIHFALRLTDRTSHARVLQLPAAIRDPRVLRTLLLLDLEARPPSPLRGFGGTEAAVAAIDVVEIELDPAPARITQFS